MNYMNRFSITEPLLNPDQFIVYHSFTLPLICFVSILFRIICAYLIWLWGNINSLLSFTKGMPYAIVVASLCSSNF